MKLQYFASVWSETKEMKYMVDHAREVRPGEYKTTTPDGREAKLVLEGRCVYVYY